MLATLPAVDTRPDPDAELMLKVREDDRAAFDQLVQRHLQRVRSQLFLMTGDRDEAEDLAQDVFLRVYRNRKGYRATAKFATWLYHIVRNVGRNAVRSRRRRPALSLGPVEHDEMATPVQDRKGELPSQPLERRELGAVVRQALATLHQRQRDALFLQQFEDRSYLEIADRLALTPTAAKSLLYRARIHLRQFLSPYVNSDDS